MKTSTARKSPAKKITEPVTDLRDRGTSLQAIIELPGISEETIRIDLEKTTVTVHASDDTIRYKKVIRVPCEVRLSKKQFLNEKLELILEKKCVL